MEQKIEFIRTMEQNLSSLGNKLFDKVGYFLQDVAKLQVSVETKFTLKFFGTNMLIFCNNSYALFGCIELTSVLNWQWKTKSTNSMEYHKKCLDARGIQL
jgi:hypothetical protein